MKTLKLWNGRGGSRKDPTSGCWIETGHCYIAALSKAEAIALMRLAGFETFTRHELDEYYVPGCWGSQMEEVKRVRGVWAARPGQDFGPEKPIKLI
jgi:hypothetical protein